jgi:CRP-like cAMP-binding protein
LKPLSIKTKFASRESGFAGETQVLKPHREGFCYRRLPTRFCTALGRSRVRAISGEDRDQLLTIPAIAQWVVEQMAFVLGQKQEALANFAHTRHIERVRRKLLQLAHGYGRVVRDGIRIDFPVSHAVLAEMIGSSRETVTRAVDELQRDGFVARRGHTYRLLVSPESVLGARL